MKEINVTSIWTRYQQLVNDGHGSSKFTNKSKRVKSTFQLFFSSIYFACFGIDEGGYLK